MRTIKVRAWDKENKKFGYFTLTDNLLSWPSNSFITSDEIIDKDGFESARRFENIEGFQEFTSLKDKNGKEIYEGDVVKDKYGSIITIEWNNDEAMWSCRELPFGNAKDYFQHSEIIGNIHENPELLKD